MYYWNKIELELFLEYQKYSNYLFIHLWQDLDIEDINSYLMELETKMCIVNKFVNIYKKNELVEIVRFIDIGKIEDEYENLLIWFPVNFKDKNEMLNYLTEELKKTI